MPYLAENSINFNKKLKKTFITPVEMYPFYHTQTATKLDTLATVTIAQNNEHKCQHGLWCHQCIQLQPTTSVNYPFEQIIIKSTWKAGSTYLWNALNTHLSNSNILKNALNIRVILRLNGNFSHKLVPYDLTLVVLDAKPIKYFLLLVHAQR